MGEKQCKVFYQLNSWDIWGFFVFLIQYFKKRLLCQCFACRYVCVPLACVGVLRGLKRALDPLDLEE